jgi:hypothetical protein
VAELTAVTRFEPLTWSTEALVKFVPVAVSVNAEPPVSTVVGLMLPRVGAGICEDVDGTGVDDDVELEVVVVLGVEPVVLGIVVLEVVVVLDVETVLLGVVALEVVVVLDVETVLLGVVVLELGAVTVKFWMAEVPPPGAGVKTEIFRVPAAAMSLAGMVAVS